MTPALQRGERLRRTERFIAYLRFAVVLFNTVLYLTVATLRGRHGLALTVIVIAGVYAIVTLFWDPEDLNPSVMPVATMVMDNLLIALWLHATGGFESPFFPLFYAEAAASVGRFGTIIGMSSAGGSALLYLLVVRVDGGAPGYHVVARIAYIFFIAAFVAYVVEVSRQAEREATTAEATAQAFSELARLKAAFVSTISHELRTPLTTIKGATSTLLREDQRFDQEQTKTLLGMVERQSGHLGKLIQDLIDVATLEQGDIEFQLEWCDMQDVVAEEVQRLERQSGRSIELVSTGGLDQARCDRVLLSRVFRNLLDNAVKFSPGHDPISVRLSQDDDRVFVDVIDSGIGIASHEQDRIFDRFYQVDSSLTRRAPGTGIGLNIARELVRLHRGDIHVHSRMGEGSRFHVVLPKDPGVLEIETRDLRSA